MFDKARNLHDGKNLVPTVILNALRDQPIPVYGRGENIRDRLHVHDHSNRYPLPRTLRR